VDELSVTHKGSPTINEAVTIVGHKLPVRWDGLRGDLESGERTPVWPASVVSDEDK
jgi:hypothetical protein